MSENRAATQRDLSKLHEWAGRSLENLMKTNAKFCTYNRPQYQMRTDWLWSGLDETDLKDQAATELSM